MLRLCHPAPGAFMPASNSATPSPDGANRPAAPAAGDALAQLRDPRTIRLRCAAITAAVADERSGWFRLDRSRLPALAAHVVGCMRQQPSDLVAATSDGTRPLDASGDARQAQLDSLLAELPPAERVRARVDLAVISALLDTDPGAAWAYREGKTGAAALPATALPAARASRDELLAALDRAAAGPALAQTAAATADADARRLSGAQGLAVASLHAFMAGAFSATPGQPGRVDAAALRQVDAAALRGVFQAGSANALTGLEGRAALLVRLGQVLQHESERDGVPARPALLLDRLTAHGARTALSAPEILHTVLQTFAPLWSTGATVLGVAAGDVWPHRFAGGDDPATRGWVPLHARAQGVCLALLPPLQAAGIAVSALAALTAVSGHDSGGLLLDAGVLHPRTTQALARVWKPGDEFVVEWRALTVTLLDELAAQVRTELGPDAAPLALAGALGAGIAAAGRALAVERRGGEPALRIDGDGMLF